MASKATDRIYIRDLMVRCIIGIYPDERKDKQDVVFNVVLETDLREAGRTDRIEDTINYKSIKKDILAMAEASNYNLIESLADRAAAICLEDRRVSAVEVTVDKPAALRFARSVAVSVRRSRDENGG
jgi:D-erythro-7,8-dihydroneopterin triphosphate epimerase